MLCSTSPRKALLACSTSLPWSLPSFTMESTLSSPCSSSDSPLFRQGAATVHLDSLLPYDLALWTDGSVPFSINKHGSGVLANGSLCDTEVTLSFLAGSAQSSFSSSYLLVSAAPISLQLLFSFSYLTLVLSSSPCPFLHLSFYLKSLWQIWK